MTNNIKVMRRCADREERTLILAVIEAPAKLYILRLRRAMIFQTGNGEVHGLTHSFAHLLSCLVMYQSTKILEVAVHVVVA